MGIDVFLIEDARVVIAVELQRHITGRQRGCITCYLHRLVVYHLCKPIDNDKDQIVARVFPIGRHRQSCMSRGLCKQANDNENQIVTGVLPISSGNCRSL